jgi:Protein of unknown function (DUF1592)/Protein of unknown function (DUF1588)/Protein of unknown function (DUF1587)/Protein of unknown function (DUF1595)/Protein of unknown function (DUF1585)
MTSRFIIAGFILFLGSGAGIALDSQPDGPGLERHFSGTVHPFLENYCLPCHGPEKHKGKLDLSADASVSAVRSGFRRWEIVLEKIEAEEMPPEEAKRHPSPEERRAVIEWILALRDDEARRHAGDPGVVLARRLSRAEYDHTIRDLTGLDIRPAREFPVDPANEAGFDNSGESLAMSPTLLKKYLAAAREVADHLVLKPAGFDFAPGPAVAETDRDHYCVQRIEDFYQRHQVDYADYFLAAWNFKHRDALGKRDATLAGLAAENGISASYLETVWSLLSQPSQKTGPVASLQSLWRQLPAPDANPADRGLKAARRGCEGMRDFVVRTRAQVQPRVEEVRVRGISEGSQPFVLWKDRQLAESRRRFSGSGKNPAEATGPEEDWRRFCQSFPDAFFVSKRGLYSDPKLGAQVRLLSAGFHLMQGYFRDDEPLYRLILDQAERREIDGLWRELDFITLAPLRQYRDFVFFERAEPPRFMQGAEFDFARSEDKEVTSEPMIRKLAEAYLAKAGAHGAEGLALHAIQDYFTNISAEIRWVETARLAAEPSHLEALQEFAGRAYRRPLTAAEREDLIAFYRSLREEGLTHMEAVRDSIVSVLMSPYFCYRIDLAGTGPGISPLSDYSLASRLSYVLWASMPDAELFGHAAAGDLHRPEVLLAQTRRMLRDGRVRGLATEFEGNWLDFRRFEEHNAVDRERFKCFTSGLRQAMFEEPIRFFVDLVRRDGSVLDFLDGDYTLVNAVLARHYGMPFPDDASWEWVRIDQARTYGRGGLLPMAVFLTQNAPGLRTSPVKRGNWVVRRLLGQRIPPPPAKVPQLPADESKTGDLTLPQLLARHRQDKSCAGCHQRFDSIGLVFEGYGPVGERREVDLAGRPVDAHAIFPDGSEGTGLDGLRGYLRGRRQEEFVDNLCRKLLAYTLSRSLMLSDEAILQEMKTKLAADGHRFGRLVEAIVTSPQFLTQRGGNDLTQK